MRGFLCLASVIFTLLFPFLLNVNGSSPLFTFQIHSWNDVREIPQALMKGARLIKIDLFFLPLFKCLHLRNVSYQHNGCVVLQHDEPLRRREYYNFSDFLNVLSDDNLRLFTAAEDTLFINMCFKFEERGGNPCSRSRIAVHFQQQVTRHVLMASEFVKSFDVNVEFILDGSASPTPSCLRHKWRPLVSTYISHKDPPEAFYSDTVENGYDRFRVLNEREGRDDDPSAPVRRLAEKNFGKFLSHHERYPFLIWEPHSESAIRSIARAYRETVMPRQLAFSINIDPAQFLVYSAKENNGASGWNENLIVGASLPHVLADSCDEVVVIVVIFFDGETEKWKAKLLHADRLFGEIHLHDEIELPHLDVKSVSWNFRSDICYGEILVFGVDGKFCYLSVECMLSTPFSIRSEGTLSSGRSESVDVSFFSARMCGSQKCIFAAHSSSFDICVSKYNFDGDSSSVGIISSFCIESQQEIIDSSLALSSTDKEILLFYTTSNGKVWIYGFDTRMKSSHQKGVVVGSGRTVHVSSYNYKGIDLCFLLLGDSFCPNSFEHNFRADVHVCDLEPRSTVGVMTYSLFPFDLFSEKNKRDENPVLSSCGRNMLHGSYGSGHFPVGAIFGYNKSLSVVAVHGGISSDSLQEKRELESKKRESCDFFFSRMCISWLWEEIVELSLNIAKRIFIYGNKIDGTFPRYVRSQDESTLMCGVSEPFDGVKLVSWKINTNLTFEL